MADSNEPPRGRFQRFRKLATLSAQLSGEVVSRGVKRLAGGESSELFGKGAAEKLVATLGDLKGAAMKIGQAASMDPDLFSPEVRQVLARLQNQAPAMDWSSVKEVITEELGDEPHKLYAHVDEIPLAAASLGQVHRARMADGRDVVIKIQYPGIGEALKSDLSNLGFLVKAVSAAHKVMDGRKYYEEVAQEMTRELDYEREADLADEYRQACDHIPYLKVPYVVRERVSKRVLTLEHLPGITLKEVLAKPEGEVSEEERWSVARGLVAALNAPFLRSGLAHTDPHPGNFMVMPDGKVGIMDFGAIKHFSQGFAEAHRDALKRATYGESLEVLPHLRAVGFTVDLPDDQAIPLITELIDIILRPLRTDAYDFGMDTMPQDVRRLAASNTTKFLRVRPPAEGVLFFRAFGGLGQNLKALHARGNFRALYQELLEASELARQG